jgi:DNA-directed RNA polymerase specialized sigma24 family protein
MTEEYFNKVYQETKKYILSKILKFDINLQTAEDILQKVYFKFFKKGEDNWKMGECVNWLKIVAKTTTIQHLEYINASKRAVAFYSPVEECVYSRRKNGVREVNPILVAMDLNALSGCEKMIEDEKNNIFSGTIQRLIAALPKKQKQAMELVYLEGYKARDAAVIMKSNESCLGYLLNSGRNKIKEKLKYVQNLL